MVFISILQSLYNLSESRTRTKLLKGIVPFLLSLKIITHMYKVIMPNEKIVFGLFARF